MENDVLITGMFLGAGLLAYVVIPGLLVMWERVLDHMESTGKGNKPPLTAFSARDSGSWMRRDWWFSFSMNQDIDRRRIVSLLFRRGEYKGTWPDHVYP
jgi:hypothetical protein